jgi:protein-L-isoaspartate(D-aspartate) O-methyltransferase
MAREALDETALVTVRRVYARQMLSLVGIDRLKAPRLEDAFASVPRERFLGPPPWKIMRPPAGYLDLPQIDPVLVYQDVLIALAPERGVNNGSPSLHAHWLNAVAIQEGERVAHIGAGAGYYSAIIAHLVGPRGRVTAVEFDAALAEAARRNLADRANVDVVQADGGQWPREDVDCVYVNFAVARPAGPWIEHLADQGRLIFPLGVSRAARFRRGRRDGPYGAAFLIMRLAQPVAFSAKWLGHAFFVGAEGELAESTAERQSLIAAFERGGAESVRSLRWRAPPSPDRSWLVGAGWSLSFDET